MKAPEYKIESPDYWELDAFLVIDGKRHYFQFGIGEEPDIKQALWYLFAEGKIQIIE